jgi:hypothetical protein
MALDINLQLIIAAESRESQNVAVMILDAVLNLHQLRYQLSATLAHVYFSFLVDLTPMME